MPCEEPPALVDRVIRHWRDRLNQSSEQNGINGKKNEITARLDEIITTSTHKSSDNNNSNVAIGDRQEKLDLDMNTATATATATSGRMLQLKFRNVVRVCVSAAVFKEFASTSVINTRTRDMGMMLMCIMNASTGPFSTAETERWMKHDTMCPHTELVGDMHAPSDYTGFGDVYSANGEAEAVTSMLIAAFVTDQDKAQRPSDLRVAVHKGNRRQFLMSGLEQFDLSSAIGRLREILVTESKLDMLHTIVFNLVFQEDTCTMHLFVSQLKTLHGEGDALCDILLRHHVRSYVSRLDNPSMEIVPFTNEAQSSMYRECMLRLPISIPNPINIGANVYTYIAERVHRFRGKGKANRVAGSSRRPY